MFCSNCGKEMEENAKFCSNCGTPIEKKDKQETIEEIKSEKDITTKSYEESKFTSYKRIKSKTEIIEEVKKILLSSKNKDNNCISLYDVSILLKKLYNEYESIKRRYQRRLYYTVCNKIGEGCLVLVGEPDFEKKIINISFSRYGTGGDIYLKKRKGDLYVIESKSSYTNEVFSASCSILSEMYDELLKYADYNHYKYLNKEIKPVNSNFSVNICKAGVWIIVKDFTKKYSNKLELSARSCSNVYELECNSSIVHEAFNGKETEIFKRIFVKISDCPEWSQAMLYEIRQNQLAEEQKIEDEIRYKKQKIEDEIRYKEMRKEKRLALIRKIFPFLKNNYPPA